VTWARLDRLRVMSISKQSVLNAKLLGWCGLLTTIAVSTIWSAEPVNAPKMLVLCSFTSALLWSQSRSDFSRVRKANKILFPLVTFFVLWIFLTILFSKAPAVNNFYGSLGRNTGLLTYISLTLLMVFASSLNRIPDFNLVLRFFFYAGVVNLVYCFGAMLGYDVIPWNNIYNAILGTFGNPNFISSFLGMLFSAFFVQLLRNSLSIMNRVLLLSAEILIIFEIKDTDSTQGFVLCAAGTFFVTGVYIIKKTRRRIFGSIYLLLTSVLGGLGILGVLQKGPLASVLYKDSLTYRGVYWEAGWNMGLEHPFFGVGMDTYGDWYRRARSTKAIIDPGVDTITNTAHNVFIDILAYGGFPLLLSYVAIVALIIRSAIRILKNSHEFEPIGLSLIVVWGCYQLQSLISINQIGLAVWGWIFGGLIIAYDNYLCKNLEKTTTENNSNKPRKSLNINSDSPELFMRTLIGFVIGFAIAFPPFLADATWRSAIQSQNLQNLETAINRFPTDPIRISQSIVYFMNYKEYELGLKYSKVLVNKFPENFEGWEIFSKMPGISKAEKSLALSRLRELDPLNPKYSLK